MDLWLLMYVINYTDILPILIGPRFCFSVDSFLTTSLEAFCDALVFVTHLHVFVNHGTKNETYFKSEWLCQATHVRGDLPYYRQPIKSSEMTSSRGSSSKFVHQQLSVASAFCGTRRASLLP